MHYRTKRPRIRCTSIRGNQSVHMLPVLSRWTLTGPEKRGGCGSEIGVRGNCILSQHQSFLSANTVAWQKPSLALRETRASPDRKVFTRWWTLHWIRRCTKCNFTGKGTQTGGKRKGKMPSREVDRQCRDFGDFVWESAASPRRVHCGFTRKEKGKGVGSVLAK